MGCAWRAGTPGWAPGGVTSCRASSRKGGGLRCIVHFGGRAPVGCPLRGNRRVSGWLPEAVVCFGGPPWSSREIGSTAMYRAATSVCVSNSHGMLARLPAPACTRTKTCSYRLFHICFMCVSYPFHTWFPFCVQSPFLPSLLYPCFSNRPNFTLNAI